MSRNGKTNGPELENLRRIADRVCTLLRTIYVENADEYRALAQRTSGAVESLAAAAIMGMLESELPQLTSFRAVAKGAGDGGLPIPAVPPGLVQPISCLVQAATELRHAFLAAAAREPESLGPGIRERAEAPQAAERVLGRWRRHVGLDGDDLSDDGDRE